MGNAVTWFEVNGPDPDQTAKFYAELFGWHTDPIPGQDYVLIDTHAGSGINGGFGKTREGQAQASVFYAEGPDIQALLDKAESLGGKTVVPVTVVPDMVTFAQFLDPFGNTVGLAQGDGSVLRGRQPAGGLVRDELLGAREGVGILPAAVRVGGHGGFGSGWPGLRARLGGHRRSRGQGRHRDIARRTAKGDHVRRG